MKILITLLTYILLIVTLSILPINSSAFTLDLQSIFSNDNLEEVVETPQVLTLTSLTDQVHFVMPSYYEFAVDASKPLVSAEPEGLTYTLDVYQNDTLLKSFNETSLLPTVTKTNTRYTIQVPLDQSSLGLEPNNYKLVLSVGLLAQKLNDDIQVFYANEALQPNGLKASEVATQLVPYYYPDVTESLLVPIYKEPVEASNYYRTVINSLRQVPALNVLDRTKVFPHTSYIWYSAGTLELKFTSDNLGDYTDLNRTQLAVASMLKSFEASAEDTKVNTVRLVVNNSQNSTAFGGLNLKQDFVVDRSPRVYMPLLTQDEGFYWVPFTLTDDEDPLVIGKQIFEAYTQPQSITQDPRFVAMLPQAISLEDTQLVGSTLKLTVSQAIDSSFGNRRDYVNALLEGLALSFTSIPYVDNIEFYIGDTKLKAIGPIMIDVPLEAPDYFNVYP